MRLLTDVAVRESLNRTIEDDSSDYLFISCSPTKYSVKDTLRDKWRSLNNFSRDSSYIILTYIVLRFLNEELHVVEEAKILHKECREVKFLAETELDGGCLLLP